MFGFGFGFSIGSLGASGYVPTNAMAIAYMDAAGFTDAELKKIIDTRVNQLQNTGLLSRLTHAKLNITDSTNNTTSLTQCSLNLINPATAQTIYTNTPTANYSGVAYNGTTQFARLGYNPSTDGSLGLANTTLIGYAYSSASAYISWAQRGSGTTDQIGVLSANTGIVQNFINDSGGTSTFPTLLTTSGFIGASRNNVANTKYLFKNNLAITQTGVATTGRASLNLVEGGRTLDNTTISNYYPIRAQFVALGQGFSVAEMALIEPIINGLQGDLDLLFGLTGTNARKRY